MNEYKSFNRIFVILAIAFTAMALRSVYGASGVVGPKKTFVLSYSTTVSTVVPTVAVSTFGVNANAQYYPGAVYQVVQGTGAWSLGAPGFFMMYDSSFTQNVGGTIISCGQTLSLPTGVVPLTSRLIYSSSFTTVTRFDPPLLFENGLVVCNSEGTSQAAVTFEAGRGLSGQ